MHIEIAGTYTIVSWDEHTWEGQPFSEVRGTRETRALVRQAFHGVIEGEALCQQLIAYIDDTTASFVGLHRVTGLLGGRRGSFVLEATGQYAEQRAEATWRVVPGSGTSELTGLEGEGGYGAQHADYPQVSYTFVYRFTN